MSARPATFVHEFLPASAPGLPVLLTLHGTGGDEHDLPPIARALLPGAAILSPRGQVLEHGMPRFFRRLAVGVFDVPDLKSRAVQLAEFIAEASLHYAFDPQDVVSFGYSNGANIAAAAMLLRPRAFAGAALLRPMTPFDDEPLPDLNGVRVLVSAGTQDEFASEAQTAHLESMLTRAGAEVRAHRSRAGHTLVPEDFAAARDFLGAWKTTSERSSSG